MGLGQANPFRMVSSGAPIVAFADVTRARARPMARPSRSSRARRHYAALPAGPLLARALRSRLATAALTLVFLGAVGFYGAVQSGRYGDFTASYGTPADMLARTAGFGVRAVTISGSVELTEAEILEAAGVRTSNSLPFLDIGEVRDRLMTMPLVREASVRKLYPGRLLIDIREREPFALWQKDGRVAIVSADGTVIDDMHDDRFLDLPFVVGEGANGHLADYVALLENAGDLRSRIRAGMYVGGRRWSLKLTSGIEVKLPEKQPGQALAALAVLQREARVLDKDIIAVDLRTPGRVAFRLSAEAADRIAEAQAKKPKAKGSQT